ncbi:hypothetical protein AB0D13_11400 [Streptomyces sp. NPDC048430]|uniref:hypothetical protein n=1 Tax=Streptomyces sp. NPDC048430 TaxID=3155388 RepID=UPI0034452445
MTGQVRDVTAAAAVAGRTPVLDVYLWVKLPGESDGCKGSAGSFTPDYAYELATG